MWATFVSTLGIQVTELCLFNECLSPTAYVPWNEIVVLGKEYIIGRKVEFPTCCTEGYLSYPTSICHVEDRVECHALAGNVHGISPYPSHVIHT